MARLRVVTGVSCWLRVLALFGLECIKFLYPIADFVAQDLKVYPFIGITFVFRQKGHADRCVKTRDGSVDQITEMVAQLFVDKGVLFQP